MPPALRGWPAPGVKREELEEHLKVTDARLHERTAAGGGRGEACGGQGRGARRRGGGGEPKAAVPRRHDRANVAVDRRQLSKQCEERGLPAAGGTSREEMLVALAEDQRKRQGQLRLTGGGGASSSAGGASGEPPAKRLRKETLPDNLHSLSLAQLKSVCAAHGFIAKGETTAAVIADIEGRLYKGTDAAPLLLE